MTGNPIEVLSYADACTWRSESAAPHHVLLGNGFSMAYDPSLFGYAALADRAKAHNLLSPEVAGLMASMGTPDFEAAMRSLDATATTLRALDAKRYSTVISQLESARGEISEALARSVAGLHPDRPSDIGEDEYLSVRTFLKPFRNIYTVNYDLLLYWALMQDLPGHKGRSKDDGFRDSGVSGDETVLWDIYDAYQQSVYYLHGALHLFIGSDGLRKLTWVRTDVALIDQTRAQLASNSFPLYVAEGDSAAKLDRINRSGYLARGLRSMAQIGGSLTVFGHSLDVNDTHVLDAVVRSNVSRMLVSLYGDPGSEDNLRIRNRAESLIRNRQTLKGSDFEVAFFDATSAGIWQP